MNEPMYHPVLALCFVTSGACPATSVPDYSDHDAAACSNRHSLSATEMLGLAAVHPAPRRALKRVVKGRGGDRNDGDGDSDGLRGASAVENRDESSTSCTGVTTTTMNDGNEEDSEEDSDYAFEDADELESDEEEDSAEHRLALQAELDECADDGRQDLYLPRMLAERARLEEDEAAWVDRYIDLQQQWKERHVYSIDDFDLDTRLGSRFQNEHRARSVGRSKKRATRTKKSANGGNRTKKPATKQRRQEYSRVARAFWRFWYMRVAPRLPLELQEERAEYVVTLLVLLAFITLSLVVQMVAVVQGV